MCRWAERNAGIHACLYHPKMIPAARPSMGLWESIVVCIPLCQTTRWWQDCHGQVLANECSGVDGLEICRLAPAKRLVSTERAAQCARSSVCAPLPACLHKRSSVSLTLACQDQAAVHLCVCVCVCVCARMCAVRACMWCNVKPVLACGWVSDGLQVTCLAKFRYLQVGAW